MRGRPPKPLKRHISEGDPSKHGKGKLQRRLQAEPKAARGLPSCPKHVRGLARTAWYFWKEELEGMEQDFRPDAMMLEGACVNYARAVEADQILATAGITVEQPIVGKEGEVLGVRIKNHPAVAVSNAAWRQARLLLRIWPVTGKPDPAGDREAGQQRRGLDGNSLAST